MTNIKANEMTENDKKDIVKRFCDQYIWLRFVFDEYRDLYEGNTTRVRLLHEVAPKFFYKLNLILVEYILLNMCKLTDPARSGKDDNLTVEYILEIIDEQKSRELGLDELSDKIHSIRKHIKPARNKIIAHNDVNG